MARLTERIDPETGVKVEATEWAEEQNPMPGMMDTAAWVLALKGPVDVPRKLQKTLRLVVVVGEEGDCTNGVVTGTIQEWKPDAGDAGHWGIGSWSVRFGRVHAASSPEPMKVLLLRDAFKMVHVYGGTLLNVREV